MRATIEEIPKITPRPLSSARMLVAAGAVMVAFATLFFFSLYWNKFAGLRSGNGSFGGGMFILAGFRPYRDVFTAGPPLNALLSAAVLDVFGKQIIVIRALGVIERLILAVLLYFWCVRIFRASHAALGAIVAIAISAGDPSNALSSYGFEAILFFMLSGFAAYLAGERPDSRTKFLLLTFASGFCAGLSFATKQTLGVGATLAVPLIAAIYIWRVAGFRKVTVLLAGFAAGWVISAGAILFWLAQLGVLNEFLKDVFVKGPSAKASHPSDFVVRASRAAWHLFWPFIGSCTALALAWPALKRTGAVSEAPTDRPAGLIGVAALASVSIAIGAAIAYAGRSFLTFLPACTIYFAFFGTGLLLLYYARQLLRGTMSRRESQICFLAAVAFAIALMVSLSWPASFDMMYPSLGLMIAAVLNGLDKRKRPIVYVLCGALLVAATCAKLNLPHGFHEFMEPPVRLADTRSQLPELKHLLLPKTTAAFIDQTVQIIRERSRPEDTIFVYPELSLFYALTGRRFPTATDSHNIDVVNDEFARSEAARLLRAKPAVLVYYRQPDWSLRADETLWRRGKPSGQRDLMAAVETLARQYQLAATFAVPPNDFKVKVYVRE